jgi:hypothetical protein
MAELTFDHHAERIVKNEVLYCASTLVNKLFKLEEETFDDDLSDPLSNLMADHDEEGNYREPLQYLIVTPWLRQKLKEKGEITAEILDLHIWGRCTYGQSISEDEVIKSIVRDLI